MNTQQNIRGSFYKPTEQAWNEGNKAKRQAMLVEAGYGKNSFYARAFAYIPQYVRDDLIFCFARKSTPPITATTNKNNVAWMPYKD
jgi:hypothetical protein